MCDAVLSALQQLPGSSSSSMPMAAVAFLVMSVALEEGSRTTAAFSQGSRAGEAGKISAAEDSDMIEGKADEEEECGGRADDAILFQGMDNAQITDQLMVLLPEKEDKRKVLYKFVAALGAESVREDFIAARAAHASGTELSSVDNTPRALGGIFIRLCKTRTATLKDKVALEATVPQQLREYQRGAVETVWANNSINYIVVAPTGSGKTAIFVELARRRLEADRDSKVLVLVPTVPLTTQHYRQFMTAGFAENGWPVKCWSSDRPLSSDDYRGLLHCNSVIVAVHQCFLNLLTCKPPKAAISEFDLLILDECHHTKKEHPYNMILSTYQKRLNSRTQLLGFTASPAGNTDMASLEVEMFALRERLSAELYVIKESNAEVQEVAPSPDELEVLAVVVLGKRVEGCMVADPVGSTQELQQLLSLCMVLAKKHKLQKLELSLQLLMNVRVAMDLVQDVGYEGAYNYLGRKLVGLPSRHHALCSAASSQQQGPPPLMFKDSLWNLPPDMLAKYLPKDAAAMTSPDGDADQPSDISGNACVPNLAQLFLREWVIDNVFAKSLFQSGLAVQAEVFPKFWTLLTFLLDQHSTGPYKGIVFLRTRQAVYYIADLIRRTKQLEFLQVIEFIGQGSKKEKNTPSPGGYEAMERMPEDRHAKGMSGEEQEARLHAFKASGCNLLVATTAAEEGLDVPTCEFVVRFHAAATGIQRVQSRGRTRMLGAKFLCILQRDTLDSRLHAKSREEERNMQVLLAAHQNKVAQRG
ncbi:MAG: hypothetical protein WDW38_004516 [Sanguina aurantia]